MQIHIYPFQHGFRESRSCETQLIDSVDAVSKNMEDGKKIDILIMDFYKTFDKVRHPLPLHKLHNYETEGKVHSWIENRTQAVTT